MMIKFSDNDFYMTIYFLEVGVSTSTVSCGRYDTCRLIK